MIKTQDFIHPEDSAALESLKAIPGINSVLKKIMQLGIEQYKYGVNMASNIRLSPTQLPHLYNILPPICRQLGIEEPEFYLQMTPEPNAFAFGDTRTSITITSGIVDMMSEEELKAVVAHECGHIACHHMLYHTTAQLIATFADALGWVGAWIIPIRYALLYWQRKSELSCDRVAAVVAGKETTLSMLARLSGGPKSITGQINLKDWARQADEYDKILNDGIWNKTLQIYAVAGLDHPFTAVRVREILKWTETSQYVNALANLSVHPDICPNCHRQIDKSWKFCQHCGTKLK